MIIERQGSIGGMRILTVMSDRGPGTEDDLCVNLVPTSPQSELFQLHAREGLPFEILCAASIEN